MLITIVGTKCSGKKAVLDYLVTVKQFVPVQISSQTTPTTDVALDKTHKHLSFLSLDHTPLTSPAVPSARSNLNLPLPLFFHSPTEFLNYATLNWRTNFATLDLNTRELVEQFQRRSRVPEGSVVSPLTAAPMLNGDSQSLDQFVQDHDKAVFGNETTKIDFHGSVNVHVVNNFETIQAFHQHLDRLNLLDPAHLRPDWDTYFMTLATLASHRSNCMKRRVGAVLVRDKRIVSTGYNGTPWNVTNCKDGGCPRCNGRTPISDTDECVCLHAEENALLESGRGQVGQGAVLYCNTCPCLKCTVKIIQTGVKTVVYNLEYKVDDASAALFKEAGVELRRFDPQSKPLAVTSQHLAF